jgi:hypothetical protein
MVYIELIHHETEEQLLIYSSVNNIVPSIGDYLEYKETRYCYKVTAVTHKLEDVLLTPRKYCKPSPSCIRVVLHVKPL